MGRDRRAISRRNRRTESPSQGRIAGEVGGRHGPEVGLEVLEDPPGSGDDVAVEELQELVGLQGLGLGLGQEEALEGQTKILFKGQRETLG